MSFKCLGFELSASDTHVLEFRTVLSLIFSTWQPGLSIFSSIGIQAVDFRVTNLS